jgi:hypothetical protein
MSQLQESHVIANMYFSFLQKSGLPSNSQYVDKLTRLGVKPAVIEALEKAATRNEPYPLRRPNLIAASVRSLMLGKPEDISWGDLTKGELEIITVIAQIELAAQIESAAHHSRN